MVMRGYRMLREQAALDRIPKLMRELTVCGLKLGEGCFSEALVGKGADFGELALRQYLLLRLAGIDLKAEILASLTSGSGKIVYPLPLQWQEVLSCNGLQVGRLRSSFLWWGYVFALFLNGVLTSIGIISSGLWGLARERDRVKRYAYFYALAANNLPDFTNSDRPSRNIASWYLQWSGRNQKIVEIRHSVSPALQGNMRGIAFWYQQGPLPGLRGGAETSAFTRWAVNACVQAFVDMLTGRWWHAVLLKEAAFAAQARVLPRSCLADDYLFHNSGWIYRPLWTYEVACSGSRVFLYFYSTNCEGFKTKGCYPVAIYGYESMNWPNYLVWDAWQADFVRRVAQPGAEIKEVGPVWFSDNVSPLPHFTSPVVGLFDITPHRVTRYRVLGLADEYYTPEVAVPYVQDVLETAAQLGLQVAWKRKRNIGRLVHPKYRNMAAAQKTSAGLIIVDADISAFRLIESCDIVVSMPFTSTALIARHLGKQSVFYDPSGLIELDDRGAHGVPVLTRQDALQYWLKAAVALCQNK